MASKVSKAAPLLSAEWINSVVEDVIEKMEDLFDHLIDDGLLASGYLPFEAPLDAKIIRRMTAEQIQNLLDETAAIEDQANILRALEGLPATVIPEPTQPAKNR